MQSYQKACKTLELEGVSIETVRKQYKLMALKYHPDKNKTADAHTKYLEIKEAHDYLLVYLENRGGEAAAAETESWTSTVSSFFETLYNNQHLQKRVFHPLLMRIIQTCETTLFEKMDTKRATKIYEILVKYKDSLHLSDDFLKQVNDIICKRCEAATNEAAVSETIILNPNLDDLLNQSVYKLKVDGEEYFVPLWHSELVYGKTTNKQLIVQCEPELPDNVELDENNNIHLYIRYNLVELWNTRDTNVEFSVGSQKRTFCMESLKIKRGEQVILKKGEGIPLLAMFDVEELSDIYLHITLE